MTSHLLLLLNFVSGHSISLTPFELGGQLSVPNFEKWDQKTAATDIYLVGLTMFLVKQDFLK